MGQSESLQTNSNYSLFFKTFSSQFKPIESKNEIQSGQIYVNEANQEMVIEIPYRIFNHESDEPWQKSQIMIKKIQAPYIIDYFGSIEKQTSEICSTSSIILSYFEYIPHNLEKEILQRKQHQEAFSEKEIWYFLWSISQALYDLKQKGYYHKDLRPATIALKSNGQIKLCPIGILLDQDNSINKYIDNKLESSIPPTLKKQLSQNQQPKIQWNLIDAYALGQTMLDLMILNLNNNIDEQQIIELQNQCYNHYSIQLIRIMELLMSESENQLIIDDVYYILKPYNNKIINFQDFKILYEEVKQQSLHLNNTLKCKSVIESFPHRYTHLTKSSQHQRAQSEIIYETQQYQQQSIKVETQQLKQQIQPKLFNNLESERSQSRINHQNNDTVSYKIARQDIFPQEKEPQFRVQDICVNQQQLSIPNQQPKLLQKILLQSQLVPSTQQPQQHIPSHFPQTSPIIYGSQSHNQASPQIQSSSNVIVGPSPTILDQPIDPSLLQKTSIMPISSKFIQPSVVIPKAEIQYGSLPQINPNQIINRTAKTINPSNHVNPTEYTIDTQNQQYHFQIPLQNVPYQASNYNFNLPNQQINSIPQTQTQNQNFTTPIQPHKITNLPLKSSNLMYSQTQQPNQTKQAPIDNFKQQYNNFDRIQNVLRDSEDLLQQINKQ
ncbi:unnamed protein product [Paramecium sonneborni]|uniref:Protein kinase domain-containing protein n=1 Tax=Paramecium sonneborni TaxID=65129 RepID=A0A8S1QKW2_9CILI|nr:unnamed protein product [Paramecium sonneborni]